MAVTSFDTLAYAKKLREAGFTEQQAEIQAEALRVVVDETLATKHDIELLQRDLQAVGKDLRHELKETEARIIFRLGGLIVVGISILAILVRIL